MQNHRRAEWQTGINVLFSCIFIDTWQSFLFCDVSFTEQHEHRFTDAWSSISARAEWAWQIISPHRIPGKYTVLHQLKIPPSKRLACETLADKNFPLFHLSYLPLGLNSLRPDNVNIGDSASTSNSWYLSIANDANLNDSILCTESSLFITCHCVHWSAMHFCDPYWSGMLESIVLWYF